jgi:hypothetical protein
MKRLMIAGAAMVASVYGSASHAGTKALAKQVPAHKLAQECGCHGNRINYDFTEKAERLEDCLVNEIPLYGPNVLLINLDNRCQVEKYEREGIFLQTGDLLFVTGRENKCAGQEWEEPYWEHNPLDYDILFPGLDYDMPLILDYESRQEIVVLEAVGTGTTVYEIDLYWGHETVREVELKVYVDQQPGLTVTGPRHIGIDEEEHCRY